MNYLWCNRISHPEILIRKPIRSSKTLRIDPKFRHGGILGNFVFRSGPKLWQEVISRNDPETLTLDPERDFIDPEKKCWSSGWLRQDVHDLEVKNYFHSPFVISSRMFSCWSESSNGIFQNPTQYLRALEFLSWTKYLKRIAKWRTQTTIFLPKRILHQDPKNDYVRDGSK